MGFLLWVAFLLVITSLFEMSNKSHMPPTWPTISTDEGEGGKEEEEGEEGGEDVETGEVDDCALLLSLI